MSFPVRNATEAGPPGILTIHNAVGRGLGLRFMPWFRDGADR